MAAMHDSADRDPSRRGSRRFEYLSKIEYALDPANAGDVRKGVAINISDKGMAAYVFRQYSKGQQIIIKSSLPVESRAATVQWVKQEDESFFLTGLYFTDRSGRS